MPNAEPKTDHLAKFAFPPGVSGNPAGRPRKRPVSEANEDLLRRECPKDIALALRKLGLPANATCADVVALMLFKQVLKGDVSAAKELRESVEGKSPQRIEVVSHEDKQIEVSVLFETAVPAMNGPRVERVIEVTADSSNGSGKKSSE